jgi:hypothetical protein
MRASPTVSRGGEVGASIDGSTALILFVPARCGSSPSHLPRAEHTACVAVSSPPCAAYLASLQRGLAQLS